MNHKTTGTISCPRCGEKDKCYFIGKTQTNGIEFDDDLVFTENLGIGHLYYCHTCGHDFIIYNNKPPKFTYANYLSEKFSEFLDRQKEK